MDKLKNEIKSVKDRVSQMKPMLLILHRSVTDMDRSQEQIDHRVSVSEENSTWLEKRLTALEEYIVNMGQHLNGAIERINAIHQYLKEQEKDLRCDETIPSSDEEFDLEDMNEKFETKGKNNQ